jgi:cytochrome c peroxidase
MSTSRVLQRALARSYRATLPRPSANRFANAAQTFRQQGRRGYASEAGPTKRGGGQIPVFVGLAALGGAAYYAYSEGLFETKDTKPFSPKYEDYQKVYDAIAKKFENETDYDDGSYGPVVLRLAWHASGTYDKETGTGGSNGATMRFDPESEHGANAGLKTARDFLEPIKEQFPWITYSDLWTLGGVAAVQELQGPIVPWRPGRADRDLSFCTPDGRLPDAAQGQKHVRDIFYRMGFNDQEIVALLGAHALGRCHPDRSGFDGPWTFSPITMTNDFFTLLLGEKWGWKNWKGPKQYEDKKTKTLMMLPADMAMVQDPKFKKFVEEYARDNDKFFKDFSDVIVKLFELGVPFTSVEEDRFRFKPTN